MVLDDQFFRHQILTLFYKQEERDFDWQLNGGIPSTRNTIGMAFLKTITYMNEAVINAIDRRPQL